MEAIAHPLITPDAFLQQWQGHRRLTRRTIDAFPEDKLFTYSAGGMRPFSELALEMIAMAVPIANGVATATWSEFKPDKPTTKADLMALWDAQTEPLTTAFGAIPTERFTAIDKAFGQWEMSGAAMLQYAVDNEIHHRGQGYVYLRTLGIEPPPFWER